MTTKLIGPIRASNLQGEGHLVMDTYLDVGYYPRMPKNDIGWSKYSIKKRSGKYVALYNKDTRKFYVKQRAYYLGEAFIRFMDTRATWHEWKGGGFKRFVVEHYPATKPEIIYFSPHNRLSGIIQKVFRANNITPETVHEYVFRLYREDPKGVFQFDVYYHDIDLPVIDARGVKVFTGTEITAFIDNGESRTDMSLLTFNTYVTGRRSKLWSDDRIVSNVRNLKDRFISICRHRPTEEDYIDWFVKLFGMSYEDAKVCYDRRGEVRLP